MLEERRHLSCPKDVLEDAGIVGPCVLGANCLLRHANVIVDLWKN